MLTKPKQRKPLFFAVSTFVVLLLSMFGAPIADAAVHEEPFDSAQSPLTSIPDGTYEFFFSDEFGIGGWPILPGYFNPGTAVLDLPASGFDDQDRASEAGGTVFVDGDSFIVSVHAFCLEPNNPIADSNSWQWVTVTNDDDPQDPIDGTFTLTFAGQTTDPIANNAPAADVEAALEALPNIGAGNVFVFNDGSVTAPNWGYLIQFYGDLGQQQVADLEVDTQGISGGNVAMVRHRGGSDVKVPMIPVTWAATDAHTNNHGTLTDDQLSATNWVVHNFRSWDSAGSEPFTVESLQAGDPQLGEEEAAEIASWSNHASAQLAIWSLVGFDISGTTHQGILDRATALATEAAANLSQPEPDVAAGAFLQLIDNPEDETVHVFLTTEELTDLQDWEEYPMTAPQTVYITVDMGGDTIPQTHELENFVGAGEVSYADLGIGVLDENGEYVRLSDGTLFFENEITVTADWRGVIYAGTLIDPQIPDTTVPGDGQTLILVDDMPVVRSATVFLAASVCDPETDGELCPEICLDDEGNEIPCDIEEDEGDDEGPPAELPFTGTNLAYPALLVAGAAALVGYRLRKTNTV